MKRFIGFIKKEFYHIFRDKRSLFILFGMPVAQILLFGFAITNEINNVDIAVLDYARDTESQKIIQKIKASTYFHIENEILNEKAIEGEFKKGTYLKGNINTRIAKLNAGEYDAIILAATGIQKLKIENEVKFFNPISTDLMIPSMGQATLGIETTNDPRVLEIVKVLNDNDAHIESTIERSFVDTLQGGCQVPIGVKATIIDENSIRIQAIVGLPDGSEYISEDITVSIKDYEKAGRQLAQNFIDQGARELLKREEKLAFK